MRRRTLLGAAGAALASATRAGAGMRALIESTQTGWQGYDQATIIDALGFLHNPDTRAQGESGFDERAVADAVKSGLAAINQTLYFNAAIRDGARMDPYETAVTAIGDWEANIRRYSDQLTKILTGQDILNAKTQGKVGVIFGFQNADCLGDRVERVDTFANLGVRIMQPTYNRRNQLGDGSLAEGNRGLTAFGREVVLRMNNQNMLLDLSHSGQETCLDALKVARRPVVITHTGCRALLDLPRNKTDEELRLLADRGGVAGIYFMPMFLSHTGEASAEIVIRHIEHAVNVCGEDHVGIGTDNAISSAQDMAAYQEYIAKLVQKRRQLGISAPGESTNSVLFIHDMNGAEKYRILSDKLLARGHGSARVEKIMGGNFLRVMREVWGA